MTRNFFARSFSNFLSLEGIYHEIQSTQIKHNKHFLEGPVLQKQGNQLFCLQSNTKKNTLPMERDQGGIYHGNAMFFKAVKRNFNSLQKKDLDDSFFDENRRFWGRFTRNRFNGELLIKNPNGELITVEEFLNRDPEIAKEALGEEAIELFSQYQDLLKSEKTPKIQSR